MRTIVDCWSSMYACECDFGPYIFEKSCIKLYINGGLSMFLGKEILDSFQVQQENGFVGHCVLAFYGVKSFDISVSTYEVQNGKLVWNTPVDTHHIGDANGDMRKFGLAGTLHGFLSWVDIEIEAQKFELQILEKNELS